MKRKKKKQKNNNRRERKKKRTTDVRFFFFVVSDSVFISLCALTVRHNSQCVRSRVQCLPFASATNMWGISSFSTGFLLRRLWKNELSKTLALSLSLSLGIIHVHVAHTHTHRVVIWISFRRHFDGFSSFIWFLMVFVVVVVDDERLPSLMHWMIFVIRKSLCVCVCLLPFAFVNVKAQHVKRAYRRTSEQIFLLIYVEIHFLSVDKTNTTAAHSWRTRQRGREPRDPCEWVNIRYSFCFDGS